MNARVVVYGELSAIETMMEVKKCPTCRRRVGPDLNSLSREFSFTFFLLLLRFSR